MSQTEKVGDSVRAVDRALDILMSFIATDNDLSASELLKRVDLSRPTLYRLLRTLELKGFISSGGEPQKFRLGPSVAHLAHVWSAGQQISDIAQPMMQKLWEGTGETVALFTLQGAFRTCVAELPSAQPLSFKRGVGYREKVMIGASGRVILANLSDAARYLHTTMDAQDADPAFERELARIRERGFAVSKNELLQGAVAVAAPVFHGGGQVAGSLAVFGPSARLNNAQIEACGALLIQQAQALSLALGQTRATRVV